MSTPTTPDKPSFIAPTKKANARAVSGAVAAGSTARTTALTDGSIDQADAWIIAGAIVGGAAVGFATVWAAPANAA